MTWLFTKTPLSFFVMDLWRDEAFSFVMAQQNIFDIIRTTAIDFNPPLYYILLHYWMILFGDSEIAMRSLSLVFYGLTLFILYEIMTQVFRIPFKKSIFYFIFIAINPFLLFYAFEARMYTMVTFFVALSYYALWTNKKKLYVLALIASLYTHYFSVLILGVQLFEHLLSFFPQEKQIGILVKVYRYFTLSFLRKQLNLLAKSFQFLIPILLFFPWAVYLLTVHDFGSGDFWIIVPPAKDILYLPFVLYTGYERVFGKYYHGEAGYTGFHSYLNILLFLLLIIPIIRYLILFISSKIKFKPANSQNHTVQNHKIFSLYLWAFVPPVMLFLISLVSTPLYHPRYFIFAVPGLILLLITSVEIIAAWIDRGIMNIPKPRTIVQRIAPHSSIIVSFVVLAYIISLTQQFNKLNIQYHYKRDVSSLYSEIMAIRSDDEPIYVTSELDYHLALYYARNAEVFIFNKSYTEIPSYVGKVLIPRDAVIFTKPLYPLKAYVVFYNTFEIYSEI